MRHIDIPIHELAFVAGTRAMAGAGLGLLAADFLKPETRRTVGWTLLALGALTTVPIAVSLIRQSRSDPRLLAAKFVPDTNY
ncbi:MAG: hypothetical protein ACXWG1_09135 [Usitatibacter sp.]